MKTLAAVEAEVTRLAAIIGAKKRYYFPTYGHSNDLAQPHVEIDHAGYHLVAFERGQELSRHTTGDLDELLYQIFKGVTSEMASDYEFAHRIEGVDERREWFRLQVELLSMLSEGWGQRRAAELATILRKHPFNDRAAGG